MLAVQYIIGQLNSPVEQLIQFIYSWQDVSISLDRMNEIHTETDEENTNRIRNNYTDESPLVDTLLRLLKKSSSWLRAIRLSL